MPKGKSFYNAGGRHFYFSCTCMGDSIKHCKSKQEYNLFERLHQKKCDIKGDTVWLGRTTVQDTNFQTDAVREVQGGRQTLFE